jgi:hypothetical protein
MKKTFITDINEINSNIQEAERLLRESMSFCEDDSIEEPEMEPETDIENDIMTPEIEPEMEDIAPEPEAAVSSYIDHIRKYTLNGLAALCDNPESEEYQMLKKIFQMCDKKAEKKENMTESHRLFGILKENKKVIFETSVKNTKDFKVLKESLVKEAIAKGINPADVRLVSESKIIR